MWLWAKNFVTNTAVINNLFSQAITILTGGYIKGGDRYTNAGAISDWSKDGFWFGANGKLMGALQSDNAGNTFVGTDVGLSTVISGTPSATGNFNTALGYQAMYSEVSGDQNCAIGYQAMYSNSTGVGNTAAGFRAFKTGNGDWNTAIGCSAMDAAQSNSFCVGIGHRALGDSNGANHCIGIGYGALIKVSGDYNIGLGSGSLNMLTSGSNNVAFGYQSIYQLTTGSYNFAIGNVALYSNTGSRQINIQNCLHYAEFKPSRTGGEIYDYLKNAFFQYTSVIGVTGCWDGGAISAIRYDNTLGLMTFFGITGQALGSISHSDTNTFQNRTCIFFIDPLAVKDSSRDDSIGA